jgi:hypothetical protein
MPRAKKPLHDAAPADLEPSDESLILRWCGGEKLTSEDQERFHRLLETSPIARELCDAALPDPDDRSDATAATIAFVQRAFGAQHGDS